MKILVVRCDNFGDCVLFSGGLRCIRARWPDARIDLLVQPQVRPLFELCPHVDQVRTTARYFPWRTVLRRYSKFRGTWILNRALQTTIAKRILWTYPSYDLVLCPMSAPAENVLEIVRRTRAGKKWGSAGAQLNVEHYRDEANRPERVFDEVHENPQEDLWLHEIPRLAKFLDRFDIPSEDVQPELWLSPADREFAERTVPGAATLGIFVGAWQEDRRWPVEKWTDLLARQTRFTSVALFGGSEEDEIGGQVFASPRLEKLNMLDMTGRCTIRETAACLGRCACVVSNDSCGLHFAVAQGVPAVGLLGGYHFGRYYPWGNPEIHRTAANPMDCFHCNKHCIYDEYRCITGIKVETVLAELKQAMTGDQYEEATHAKPQRSQRGSG
ncbi:MAG: glycosyltransferase family 9 protein [Lentisphaerae bacterium]|nr:glycosyltransferase family 9 protein [Lentisphaerota bacterium]